MIDLNKFKNQRYNVDFGILSKINIKLFVTLICFGFLGNSIYRNFESLSNQEIAAREILWLLAGILFSFLSIIINA